MAALRGDSDVVDIDLDLWDRVMAVNLRGYVAAMKSAIPLMLERGGGAIVNMSSAAAFQGEPARPAYATAKAGIGALTRHVASGGERKGSGATPLRRVSLRQKRFNLYRNGRTWRRRLFVASGAPGSAAPTTSHR